MPRKYQRKTLRGSWSAEDLEKALRGVLSKEMGVNEASRNFGIPSRTLRRYISTGRSKVPLGRKPRDSNKKEQEREGETKTEKDETRITKTKNESYSSNDESEDRLDTSEEENSEDHEYINRCVECMDYYETQSIQDWIQCSSCLAWLHESCTKYDTMCNRCGRIHCVRDDNELK